MCSSFSYSEYSNVLCRLHLTLHEHINVMHIVMHFFQYFTHVVYLTICSIIPRTFLQKAFTCIRILYINYSNISHLYRHLYNNGKSDSRIKIRHTNCKIRIIHYETLVENAPWLVDYARTNMYKVSTRWYYCQWWKRILLKVFRILSWILN